MQQTTRASRVLINTRRTAIAAALQGALAIGVAHAGPDAPAAAHYNGQAAGAAGTVSTVVVTAAGFEQSALDAPASITVITRDDLEKRPFRDLTDALRDVQGVTVTGIANEQDILIRGLPGAYTLILVDGKRQSTRDARANGSAGYEQSFIPPLEAIERIEVVRGPMSSLYGSDAMGGVINIITRKVARTWGGSIGVDGTLQEHGDSGNATQGQFFLNGPIAGNALGLQLWGKQYKRTEDEIRNGFNGAKDRDLTARLSWTPNAAHDVLLEAGTSELKRHSSSGGVLAATAADTRQKHTRDHYSLSHTGRWGWATSQLSFTNEKGQRETYAEDRNGDFIRNARAPRIENSVFDAKLNTRLGSHFLVVGGQWNRAELLDQNPGRRTGVEEHFSIVQKALFVEDEWSLTDTLSLTGGLRADDHEIYGKHWSPRLYAVWHADERVTIKGGVSRGFKAPDVRSVAPGYAYTTGGAGCTYGPNGTCGVIIGDPNLKAETSTSYEISAHLDTKAGVQANATLFYTDFKDKLANALIYNADGSIARWSEDPGYRLWHSYNIDNATIRGLETGLTWQVSKPLSFKANYTYTDSKQKGGSYDGYALTRTPKHRGTLRADWAVNGALDLWASVTYNGKEINAAARSGSNGVTLPNGAKEYGDYTIGDIGATYDWSRNVAIKAVLFNVSDKRLDELTYNTVGDGRRLWLGVTTRF